MKATLLIVCESAGRAVPLARVEDESLLRLAAQSVISRSQDDVQAIIAFDSNLAGRAQTEARRLSQQLSAFVPGLAAVPGVVLQ